MGVEIFESCQPQGMHAHTRVNSDPCGIYGKEHSMTGKFFIYFLLWLMLFWKPFFGGPIHMAILYGAMPDSGTGTNICEGLFSLHIWLQLCKGGAQFY